MIPILNSYSEDGSEFMEKAYASPMLEILIQIIPCIVQDEDKDGLNLKAALYVAFAGFLLSDEFT